MQENTSDILFLILEHTDIFMVIFMRIFGFFTLLPVISGNNVPRMTRIIFTFVVAAIVFTTHRVTEVFYDPTVFGLGMLLLKELVVGLICGFVVYMMFSLFFLVGQLVDFQIGFSMVSVFDPVSQIQVPVTGNLYFLTVMVLFVQTQGIHRMIQIIIDSYQALPPGNAVLLGNETMLSYVVSMMSGFFLISIQIALPIIATIMLVDIGLGLLVKAVPQMNVFVVGMPIKLLIGLLVLTITIPMVMPAFQHVFEEILIYLYNVIKGMMTT